MGKRGPRPVIRSRSRTCSAKSECCRNGGNRTSVGRETSNQYNPNRYGKPERSVGTGLVSSLHWPGGNITGLSSMNVELGGKRLELLKEAFPNISNVVLLGGGVSSQPKEVENTARTLGIQLQFIPARGSDLQSIFSTIAKNRADAILLLSNPNLFVQRKQIVELAAKSRLPTMYPQYVDAGGLMSYGIIPSDLFYRAATYVDKILKGAKPTDLPIQQPTKFEFSINLKVQRLGVRLSILANLDNFASPLLSAMHGKAPSTVCAGFSIVRGNHRQKTFLNQSDYQGYLERLVCP